MERQVYIFGHKNPDTDSVCSAIAYAELKKKIGYKNVEAIRLGEMNRETEYVLDYFNVMPPRLEKEVKAQIKDLDLYDIPKIKREEPIRKAWMHMQEMQHPMFPVTDKDNNLEGVIAISDITKTYIEFADDDTLMKFNTKFGNLVKVLEGEVLVGKYPHEVVEGKIYTDSTLTEDTKITNKDIVITGGHKKLQKLVLELKPGAIILTKTSNKESVCYIDESIKDVAIIKSPHNFFKTIKLVNQSIPVGQVMKSKGVITFRIDDSIDEVKETVLNSKFRHFPVIDEKGKLAGTISRRHLIDFKKKNVILVDHNEKSQSAIGIEQANILEVIDHHRIAEITTTTPLYYRAEPVGCTSTIVYKMYKENAITPKKEVAGLMLSAILSDTLIFKSPTCTNVDKLAAYELAEIAGVNIDEFSIEMLIAGTSLEGREPIDIIKTDMKKYVIGDYDVLISQINTADIISINPIKENIKEAMSFICQAKGAHAIILMVTDILHEGSKLIFAGEKAETLERHFEMENESESVFIKGMLSRKKQMVPLISDVIHK